MEMARFAAAGLEEAEREPKSAGILSAIGGPQFLAAQFFTILATVLGVYLAGYEGFQRTLEYDRYADAKQSADLLTATHDELKQNVVRLKAFNERLPADVGNPVFNPDWPRLRLFVWQAAGHSSSAFNIPPQILTDLQGFYEDVGDMLKDNDAHEAFLHLTTSNAFDRAEFKKRLTEQLAKADATILREFEKAAAESEELLKKYSAPTGSAL
jgi:hypothetical protein